MVHPEGVGFFMVVAGGNDKILGISHKQKVFIKDSPLLWQFLNNSLYRFHHIPIGQEKVFKHSGVKNCRTQFLPRINSWVSLWVFL